MVCRHYMNGFCQAGANCQFAHGEHEKRNINDPLPGNIPIPPQTQMMPQVPVYPQQVFNVGLKTQLCKYFQNGYCKNQNCQFAHGLNELQTALAMQSMSRYPTPIQPMYIQQPQPMVFPIPNLLVDLQQQQQQPKQPQNYISSMNIPLSTPYYQKLGKPNKKELLKQLMFDIIQKLEEIFKHSQDIQYHLRVAKEGLANYNFAICSEMFKLIISDPARTEDEIEKYEKIYNEAQEIIKQNELE